MICISLLWNLLLSMRVKTWELLQWCPMTIVWTTLWCFLTCSRPTVKSWRNCALSSRIIYRVSQKKSSPPKFFWHFSPNGWEFLVQILHAYCTFLSTLDYKILFNYRQLWWVLCHIKRDHHHMLKMSTIGRHARWVVARNKHNFVTVGDNWIKICVLA